MATPDKETGVSFAEGSSRHLSPPPSGLRQRPLGRASTFAEEPLNRRRSSIFSESLSEARRSIRSSTDDLFLPRANASNDAPDSDDSSHWHSVPLGLALLPAVGGLFFKDGSAIITDITLLVIAAVFMNWALRMPWEWYHSAQTIVAPAASPLLPTSPLDDDEDIAKLSDDLMKSSAGSAEQEKTPSDNPEVLVDDRGSAARELRIHELLSLLCCFICPALAAWLLHGIRSQLSRPSEGLVSNYNLTIFLLVAEIRPLSHLIKMVQRRTLFLQRKVQTDPTRTHDHPASQRIEDLLNRVEELETHIANGIVEKDSQPQESVEQTAAKASARASSEVRRMVQPEIDALGRAMRRYEKRSTITAIQTETRLQELETRYTDAVTLAAAAQRSAESQPKRYYMVVVNWMCAAVVIPVEWMVSILQIPKRMYNQLLTVVASYLPGMSRPRRVREGKSSRRSGKSQSSDRKERAKSST